MCITRLSQETVPSNARAVRKLILRNQLSSINQSSYLTKFVPIMANPLLTKYLTSMVLSKLMNKIHKLAGLKTNIFKIYKVHRIRIYVNIYIMEKSQSRFHLVLDSYNQLYSFIDQWFRQTHVSICFKMHVMYVRMMA